VKTEGLSHPRAACRSPWFSRASTRGLLCSGGRQQGQPGPSPGAKGSRGILQYPEIRSLEFLPNYCKTTVDVIVIFKDVSKAKVLFKSVKITSSLLHANYELHALQ